MHKTHQGKLKIFGKEYRWYIDTPNTFGMRHVDIYTGSDCVLWASADTLLGAKRLVKDWGKSCRNEFSIIYD